VRREADKARVSCADVLDIEDFSKYRKGKAVAVLGIRHRGIARRLTQEISRATALSRSLGDEGIPSRSRLTVNSVRGKMPRQRAGSSGGRS
jgi:hypothetical protein